MSTDGLFSLHDVAAMGLKNNIFCSIKLSCAALRVCKTLPANPTAYTHIEVGQEHATIVQSVHLLYLIQLSDTPLSIFFGKLKTLACGSV